MDSSVLLPVFGFFCVGPLIIFAVGFAVGRASMKWKLVRREVLATNGPQTGYSSRVPPAQAARTLRAPTSPGQSTPKE